MKIQEFMGALIYGGIKGFAGEFQTSVIKELPYLGHFM
jgi:hypothetical protein